MMFSIYFIFQYTQPKADYTCQPAELGPILKMASRLKVCCCDLVSALNGIAVWYVHNTYIIYLMI